MNPNTTVEEVRELAQSKLMELQPYAGEEMNLLQTNPERAGFIEGERALAQQILTLLDNSCECEADPIEDEMVMSLGRT